MADTDSKKNAPDDATDDSQQSQGGVEATVNELEEILQVFPDDTATMESLLIAYQQAGRNEDAFKIGLKLAEIMSSRNNWQRVRDISCSILELKPGDEKANILLDNANMALSREEADKPGTTSEEKPEDDHTADKTPKSTVKAKDLKPNISAELDLAWLLMQNGFINQQQYKSAVSALTENRGVTNQQTNFSILPEISNLDGIDITDIMGFLVQQTRRPYLDISRFELDQQITELIPAAKCRVIGILPFSRLGNEFMAVTLNPLNKDLLKDVSACLGGKTHFYLCDPASLEEILTQLVS